MQSELGHLHGRGLHRHDGSSRRRHHPALSGRHQVWIRPLRGKTAPKARSRVLHPCRIRWERTRPLPRPLMSFTRFLACFHASAHLFQALHGLRPRSEGVRIHLWQGFQSRNRCLPSRVIVPVRRLPKPKSLPNRVRRTPQTEQAPRRLRKASCEAMSSRAGLCNRRLRRREPPPLLWSSRGAKGSVSFPPPEPTSGPAGRITGRTRPKYAAGERPHRAPVRVHDQRRTPYQLPLSSISSPRA